MTLVICPESRTNGPCASISKTESSVRKTTGPVDRARVPIVPGPNEVTTGKKTKNAKREGGQS
jgi:hypothetical protein